MPPFPFGGGVPCDARGGVELLPLVRGFMPRPTLADHVEGSWLHPRAKEVDLKLIGDTDDFDNAVCGLGPLDGQVYMAEHSRKLDGFYHKCRCVARSFPFPEAVALPRPRPCQDLSLADWMGRMPIGHLTLPSLCLPGTHDSLTYDLSDHEADGDTLPGILAALDHLGPLKSVIMGEARKVAQCQKISIQEQLNAGIRFIDFRVIWSTRSDVWVGVHGLETRQSALYYLKQIRAWLVDHPGEIVVLWLSRHGNEEHKGREQYPHVNAKQKQKFYQEILGVFGGLVVNHRKTPLKSTLIRDLVARNRRVVLICSDWADFTGKSSDALDAAAVLENKLVGGFDDPVLDALKFFGEFEPVSGKYHIVSLANSADRGAFIKQILSKHGHKMVKFFNDLFDGDLPKSKFDNVPGMKSDPWRQDDSARFTNYYAQTVLELAWCSCRFPQAIYLDMVTSDGGMEVGTEPNDKFGYVHTILAYNARMSRNQDFLAQMIWLKGEMPLRRWEDRREGRSRCWPLASLAPHAISTNHEGKYVIDRPLVDPTRSYFFRFQHSRKVWDIKEGQRGDGGACLIQWDLNCGLNQRFRFQDSGDGTYFYILPLHVDGFALDVEGQNRCNGARLHLWTQHRGPSQQFRFEAKGEGWFQVISRLCPGKALDVDGQEKCNGAAVHLWDRHDGPSQRIRFIY